MIYSPETKTTLISTHWQFITFKYIDKGPLRMLTLCTLGPLRHAWLFFPSSSCSMLPPSLLGVYCCSCFLSGGPGPPSPPSLELTPFPTGPRQRPTLVSGILSFLLSYYILFTFVQVYTLNPFIQTKLSLPSLSWLILLPSYFGQTFIILTPCRLNRAHPHIQITFWEPFESSYPDWTTKLSYPVLQVKPSVSFYSD
jgi:hypothetical protein